jgi:hypothetical protein
LHPTKKKILIAIHEGATRVLEIARRIGMSANQSRDASTQLVGRGYLTTTVIKVPCRLVPNGDPKPRNRVRTFQLTTKGHQWIAQHLSATNANGSSRST